MADLRLLKEEARPANRQAILYAVSWQDDVRAWWPLAKILADVGETPGVRVQATEGLAYLFYRKRKHTLAHDLVLELLRWTLRGPRGRIEGVGPWQAKEHVHRITPP